MMGAFETKPTFDGLSDATIHPTHLTPYLAKGTPIKFIKRMSKSWEVEIPPNLRYNYARPPHVETDRDGLAGKDVRVAHRYTTFIPRNRFSNRTEDHIDFQVVMYTLHVYENGNPVELLMNEHRPAHLTVYYGPDGSHVDTY